MPFLAARDETDRAILWAVEHLQMSGDEVTTAGIVKLGQKRIGGDAIAVKDRLATWGAEIAEAELEYERERQQRCFPFKSVVTDQQRAAAHAD
jgi:hypothetical protein